MQGIIETIECFARSAISCRNVTLYQSTSVATITINCLSMYQRTYSGEISCGLLR
jgi:hypothetical protein